MARCNRGPEDMGSAGLLAERNFDRTAFLGHPGGFEAESIGGGTAAERVEDGGGFDRFFGAVVFKDYPASEPIVRFGGFWCR